MAGHYTEAEALYRSALAAFGDVRSLARAVAMENLGVSLREQGRVAEARPLMEEATQEIAALAGEDSPEAGAARSNLAALYWSAGEMARASKLSRALLESVNETIAVTLYGNLAAASISMGNMEQAETDARRGLELANRVLPEIDARRAALLDEPGAGLPVLGRYLEAETLYREALRVWG